MLLSKVHSVVFDVIAEFAISKLTQGNLLFIFTSLQLNSIKLNGLARYLKFTKHFRKLKEKFRN